MPITNLRLTIPYSKHNNMGSGMFNYVRRIMFARKVDERLITGYTKACEGKTFNEVVTITNEYIYLDDY